MGVGAWLNADTRRRGGEGLGNAPHGEAKGGGPGRQQALGATAPGQAAREQGSGHECGRVPLWGNGRWASPGKKKKEMGPAQTNNATLN
jgi:hypothetical protein